MSDNAQKPITRLSIAGYRSLRDITLSLAPLTIVTGPNGSGKSSLYRALRLLADVSLGRIVQSLAGEGGLASTLWAGPEAFSREMKAGRTPIQGTVRKNPVRLKLGFSGADYGFAIELGMPGEAMSYFPLDPNIKVETLWIGEVASRSAVFAERRGPGVRLRDKDGAWMQATMTLSPMDSMMTHCADRRAGFELLLMRERMREWRFYDHFRTDRDAPARRPQIGTYTPVLASDGADLAAAVQTIFLIGEGEALRATVADAFAGATLEILENEGYFELGMRQYGLLRPLRGAELSDGTLRYLLLAAALLTPRPPALMVLNEPEASLHPELLAPLARLIAAASRRTQIILVSHSQTLVSWCLDAADYALIELEKQLGETQARGVDKPKWAWPT